MDTQYRRPRDRVAIALAGILFLLVGLVAHPLHLLEGSAEVYHHSTATELEGGTQASPDALSRTAPIGTAPGEAPAFPHGDDCLECLTLSQSVALGELSSAFSARAFPSARFLPSQERHIPLPLLRDGNPRAPPLG